MSNKLLGIIFVLVFLAQISFSIYFSTEIVNQNNILNKNQNISNNLKTTNKELEIGLSKLISLNYLKTQIDQLNLIPINKKINLQKQ